MALSLIASADAWICFVDGRDGGSSYRASYEIAGTEVIEVSEFSRASWLVLQDNDVVIVFANSAFGMRSGLDGTIIDQLATIIAIDRATGTLRRTFVQEEGTRVEHVDGSCIEVDL
jgi:hypothetical protein